MIGFGRAAAGIAACTLLCASLTGCFETISGSESSGGIWEGIEPVAEGEFGEPKYADGVYMTQTVKEPAKNPYAEDTKQVKTGETADGIRYALYEKHAEITGHSDDFSAEILELPAELEGLPVTAVADVQCGESIFDIDKNGAFYGCYTLEKVVVPEGYLRIGNYGFYGCKNLKSVQIAETVTQIGDRAFAMCSGLRELSVPSGIDTIGDSAFSLTPWYDNLLYHRDFVIFNGRLYDVGRRCEGEMIVPDYVVSIGDYAFYSCPNVKAIVLPESVKTVGAYAFCNCPALRSVVFLNPECEICDDVTTLSNKPDDGDQDFYHGTVYGKAGSSAEQFAKKYKFQFADIAEYQAPDPEPETQKTTAETTEAAKEETETTAAADS
ncbi:MAG TPA: hypothetical protein DCG49_13195 [Ruminococcus sp.]|nr:hypothetical protein [Ruminococcus sp.]